MVGSVINTTCPVRLALVAPTCSPLHTMLRLDRHRADNEYLAAPRSCRTYFGASRTPHLRATQRSVSLSASAYNINGTLPPGSHSARQGLAHIVILYFDSAVCRMMLQAEDKRRMRGHLRSERSSNIIRNIHSAPPDHSVSAFSCLSSCTITIGVLLSALSNTFSVSHTSVSSHP